MLLVGGKSEREILITLSGYSSSYMRLRRRIQAWLSCRGCYRALRRLGCMVLLAPGYKHRILEGSA